MSTTITHDITTALDGLDGKGTYQVPTPFLVHDRDWIGRRGTYSPILWRGAR